MNIKPPNSEAVGAEEPHLRVEAVESFNYAAWQNSVPLLRSVQVENSGTYELSSLTVELSTSPGFARPKRWTVDRVGPTQTVSLRDIDVEIDADYLDRLDEAERGTLKFRLLHRDETLDEVSVPVRILARDEWGGMGAMGELLAAFITPNDPALATLLKAASDVLAKNGHSPSLDGYQSRDPNRAYLLAASLWSAVAARTLTYANPPSSFERVGQKTRRVATVLGDGLATCLDSTLLFASGLEAMGLHPVVVMTSGHCFTGVWLVEKTLKKLVERDCSELRKAVAAKELIVFETTLITGRPAAPFTNAMAPAEAALGEAREHEFVGAVDVARARMAQVRPLATHGERQGAEEESEQASAPLSLPMAPGFSNMPAEEVAERPQTPAGRIERWQRKLLDLSLRNRLLNFKPGKQTVPVLCTNVARLEDQIANGGRLRMVSLRDENRVADRDPELHQQRTQKDLDVEFARIALEKNELACPIDAKDLEARLTALYRKGKNDLAEGGSNTLYLAVGFLRWRPNPNDEKTYRAPLLLVPVSLVRRSASSPFYLASHEDDVRFNATLLQLLKKDFACDLTDMESDLPTDDSGVDVPAVLERMRRAVRDIPGFEVVEDVAIASFSFAKYLMWKDLVERVSQLEHNRVVRHLVQEPDKAFVNEGAGPMPRPHEIDTRYKPADIVHPLPADSSQLAAVMAASEGHDMVIVGPPGTGKSQTIANMIAQCLSVGKTVLFVAEKTAALDVVHRRLRAHGLGDCCVELHSNKAERRRFLDQLDASWNRRQRPNDQDWIDVSERLRIRRDELNAYVAAAHAEQANGWTVYRAMGLCVQGREAIAPALEWSPEARHSREQFETAKEAIADAALAYGALPAGAALDRVQKREWSMAWENSLVIACNELQQASDTLSPALGRLTTLLGVSEYGDVAAGQMTGFYRFALELTRTETPPAELLLCAALDGLEQRLYERAHLLTRRDKASAALQAALSGFSAKLGLPTTDGVTEQTKRSLYRLANELIQPDPPLSELVFHPAFDSLQPNLAERVSLLRKRDEAIAAVEARSFNRSLLSRLPHVALQRDWAKAATSFWPISALKRSAVKKKLKTFMAAGATPDPDIDLPLLGELHACHERLTENFLSLRLSSELAKSVEESPAALDGQLESAKRLREAIRTTGATPEGAAVASGASVEAILSAAQSLYPPGRELESARGSLRENLAVLGLPPEIQATVEETPTALDSQIAVAKLLRNAASAVGLGDDATLKLLQSILESPSEDRRSTSAAYCQSAKRFQAAWQEYATQAGTPPVAKDSMSVILDARRQAQSVLERRTLLKQWTAWEGARQRSVELGLGGFVAAMQSGELSPSDAVARFELAYARWWLPLAVDNSIALRTFQRFHHENAIEDFRRLDELARTAASPRVLRTVYHDLPRGDQVPRKSELGLLRHQMGLKRPSRSIRDVIAGMPESFGKLAPCLLMSPLSIAQYLPAGQAPFDVVIFDEASQIATWDAIGAIARGKQTIIVGDPKQLPPTNFFGKSDSDEDNEDIEDHDKDLESILDEVKASGLPTVQLNWHYRSRHESLIAFSNWSYYGNQLVTFPAAESEDRGVSLTVVEESIYDRGKSRTNRLEAEAIVADAVARMKRCFKRPEAERLTYGVVTFNSQQQSLIQDLFDEALRRSPELEWFFADERIEPTAVKNLENVQGDERDVMYFSITFGRDAAGNFPVDFGAINRDGGERRLNVAVTRARHALLVYASFLPDQLRAERSGARGVHDLKAFLEFAYKGPTALAARTDGSVGGIESPFEEAVAEALESRGWRLDPQVGVSGFRIDLGVIHPDRPGAYLAGVECDGATYHRSAAARDRDKTRQQVLEGLGWKIVRVWSPDWWYDCNTAIDTLHNQLDELLRVSRESTERATSEAIVDDQEIEDTSIAPLSPGELVLPTDFSVAAVPAEADDARQPQMVAKSAASDTPRVMYCVADLDDAASQQARFFDADYSRELRKMALAVVEVESPVRDDVVARRVARAHGFARTGARIKDRVMSLLPEVTTTTEDVGCFLWSTDKPLDAVPFRYPALEGDRRSFNEIPTVELLGLVKSRPDLAQSDDPALAFARKVGLARLAQTTRERLEAVIESSNTRQ